MFDLQGETSTWKNSFLFGWEHNLKPYNLPMLWHSWVLWVCSQKSLLYRSEYHHLLWRQRAKVCKRVVRPSSTSGSEDQESANKKQELILALITLGSMQWTQLKTVRITIIYHRIKRIYHCNSYQNWHGYHFVGYCGASYGLDWRIWRGKMYYISLKPMSRENQLIV